MCLNLDQQLLNFITYFVCYISSVLPESARWLIAQGKLDKAEKVMRKVAKVNGTNLPENVFTDEVEVEMEEKVSLKSYDSRKER